jgi:hypothetical protein
MTTRNFRVNNGLSVGTIVISATANTITGLSTSAPTADGDVANKKYVDDGLSGLSQNSISQGNSSVTVTDSGTGAIAIAVDGSTVINTVAAGATVTGTLTSTSTGSFATGTTVGNLTLANGSITDSSGAISFENENLTTTGSVNGAAGNFTGAVGVDGNFDVATNKLTVNATTGNTLIAGTLDVTGSVTASGDLTVTGNLQVNGTTTTVNSTTVDIADLNITVASGASTSAAANGAGLTVDGASATMLYVNSTDSWDFNKAVICTSGFTGDLTGTATAAEYSDVAERFASDSMYEPGTVVALGGSAEITAVAEEASDEVFGVISSLQQAAFKMNGGAGSDETHPYVAMTGRVNVKVIGPVNKGDRLISASTAGYARAATKAECTAFNVIGRALKSKVSQDAGSVLAAVRVTH